jgi:hypothetical protein
LNRLVLPGLSGASPLGFLASLGLLRLVHERSKATRLGFLTDGSFSAFVDGNADDMGGLVAEDAARAEEDQAWRLEYSKQEKNGVKIVADLKAPPPAFAAFLARCVDGWCTGRGDAVAYAAAFGTEVAFDLSKGNTKPTALHFTAANQQFLGIVEEIRGSVTAEWATQSLFEGHAARRGSNLRWDPAAERNWALMANKPSVDGTQVDAPLEWLAFRALPLLPCFPRGGRIITTGVSGRGDDMRLTWPLWSMGASLPTVRSLLQTEWAGAPRARAARGVFAVCTSAIRRTSQGFGNFGPAVVSP